MHQVSYKRFKRVYSEKTGLILDLNERTQTNGEKFNKQNLLT